ncbi:MAG: acetate--CoA ligase family protein [Nanoarchaeota archaeon]|nr:acetate--CoA ligase family protein [Nanoarchaeota archaeon]
MGLNLFKKKKPKHVSKPKKKTVKKIIKKSVKKKTVKKAVIKKISKKKASNKKIIKKTTNVPKKTVKTSRPVKIEKKEIIKTPEINKMDDQKAFDLVQKSRLPVLKTIFIKKESELDLIKKIGFPCYMKASGSKIIHKTEIGGVIKVEDQEQAIESFKTLMKIKTCEKVIVQEFKSGIELILGAKSDIQFGHLISIGIGGIYTEILRDVSFRICPIEKEDAKSMVLELKGYEILAGARGQEPINLDQLYDIIGKLCRFATANKIKEMDINPIICNKDGCYISDIRIII